jgi:hypothetical protein
LRVALPEATTLRAGATRYAAVGGGTDLALRGSVAWLALWIAVTVVALAGIVASTNRVRFGNQVARVADGMWAYSEDARPIDRARLAELPSPVRRYLEAAVGERKRAPRALRMRHTGTFRAKLDGPWLPIRGEEYFNADPPGFVWWGRVRIVPGVWIDARDVSVLGAGQMFVKAESTFTLANSTGPQLDQSALERLLGELVWLPTALLDERYVTWTAIDERHARATIRIRDVAVEGTFAFGEDGLPLTFSAMRYADLGDNRPVLMPFSVECRDYRRVDGLLVPHAVDAYWHVDGRAIPYARFRVQHMEYDAKASF